MCCVCMCVCACPSERQTNSTTPSTNGEELKTQEPELLEEWEGGGERWEEGKWGRGMKPKGVKK